MVSHILGHQEAKRASSHQNQKGVLLQGPPLETHSVGRSQPQKFPNFPKSQHNLCAPRSNRALLGTTAEPRGNKPFAEVVVLQGVGNMQDDPRTLCAVK